MRLHERVEQASRLHRDCGELASRTAAHEANDHVVRLDRRPRVRDGDAKEPTQPVAVDGKGQRLAADNETDTSGFAFGGRADDLEVMAVTAPAGPKQCLERSDAGEPMASRA